MTTQGIDHAEEVAQLCCATLVDAMGRVHGHRAHLLPLVSPDPTRPLFGPAVTIAYLPARDDLPQAELGFGSLFYTAVADQPAGKVLVLSSGGYPEASHGGGTKRSRLEHHGLAGARRRTAPGLRPTGRLRVRHLVARRSHPLGRGHRDAVRSQRCDRDRGVCLTPGDYVYADASGAVVIPATSLDRVLDVAHRVEAEDTESATQIRDEDSAAVARGDT